MLVVNSLDEIVVAGAYLIENANAFGKLPAALWNVEFKPLAEVDVGP